MGEETTTRPSLDELTTDQPESKDPDYLAWVDEQIEQGEKDLKDPGKRIPLETVAKEFGFEG